MFPILFAAVVGRALKGILAWRIEHGERLGLLDLLAGSTTLVNTITTQLTLRILSIAGPLLVVLWAFSPLGGQASLRVMTIGNTTISNTTPLQYMVQNRSFGPFETADDATQIAIIDGLVVASLLSPWKTKLSSVDSWNNVKIPMIEALENSSLSDTDGWYTPSANNTVYSSLIGTPVTNMLDTEVNTTFCMETSYWHLTCPVVADIWQPPHTNISSPLWTGATGDSGTLTSNSSWPRSANGNKSEISAERGGSIPDDLPGRTIVYNTWDPNGENTGSICNIYTTYVEVNISCTGVTCAASELRRSKMPHPPSTWTFFDQEGLVWIHFAEIFADLISGHPATATGVQIYFLDPQNPFNATLAQGLYTLDTGTYAIRLAQLFNTVWASIVGMYAIPEGLSVDTATQNETTLEEAYDATFANTTGTKTHTIEVIQCHTGWLVTLSVASLAMVVASLAHPLVRFSRRAPDFMLNVSTMMRDSAFVDLPSTGSTLDSAERARLIKHMKVRFGDVRPEDDVGYIAVGSFGAGNHVARARKGRLYD